MSALNNHIREDRWKWVTVFVSIILIIAVLLWGIFTSWQFIPEKAPEEEPKQEQDAGGLVATPDESDETAGISLDVRRIAREQFNVYGISPMALSAQVVTATVKDSGGQASENLQKVTFTMAWKSTNSAAVTDFVTMSTTDNTATFTCLKAFGTQIVVTVTSLFDETKMASITLDYVKGFSGYSMYVATTNYEGSRPGSMRGYSVTEGEVIPVHFANVETKTTASSAAGSWAQMPFAFPFAASWGTGTVENKLTEVDIVLSYGSTFGPGHTVGSPTFTAKITSSDAEGTVLQHKTFDSGSSQGSATKWTQWGILVSLSGYSSSGNTQTMLNCFGGSVDGAPLNYPAAVNYLKALDRAEKPIEGTLTLSFQYGAAKTIKFYLDVNVAASSVKSLEVDHSGLLFYA